MRKRLQYNSPVILTIFFLSLASLILGHFTAGWTTTLLFSVYRSSLLDPLTYVRLIGHIFGHGGFEHFLGNMLLLLVVGPPLEEKYGSKELCKWVLITAAISGILHSLLFPNSALVGASGIVFMLIMLASLAGMEAGAIPITLILVAILYLGQEIYSILFVRDNVANLIHLVGGAAGTAFGSMAVKGRKK